MIVFGKVIISVFIVLALFLVWSFGSFAVGYKNDYGDLYSMLLGGILSVVGFFAIRRILRKEK